MEITLPGCPLGAAESGETYNSKNIKNLDKPDLEKMIAKLEQEMRQAARDLAFEKAAEARDVIIELRKEIIARSRHGHKSERLLQDAAAAAELPETGKQKKQKRSHRKEHMA